MVPESSFGFGPVGANFTLLESFVMRYFYDTTNESQSSVHVQRNAEEKHNKIKQTTLAGCLSLNLPQVLRIGEIKGGKSKAYS